MIITRIENIDIVDDVLYRPEALNWYLGQEVNDFLKNKLSTLTEPTLLNIDLRKTNPIDYSFTRVAFGPFFSTVSGEDGLDVIFCLNKSQVKSLLWGILESLERNTESTGNAEVDFRAANCCIKVSLDNSDIQFISNLTTFESTILDFINDKGNMVDKDLYHYFEEAFALPDITDAIRTLKAKKFIYGDEKKIISVKHQIKFL